MRPKSIAFFDHQPMTNLANHFRRRHACDFFLSATFYQMRALARLAQ